ncbi:MAG: pirin family protein [Myxococcaceae bacterium]|nr:pirin family protein [Myxococcaceae bacterium]
MTLLPRRTVLTGASLTLLGCTVKSAPSSGRDVSRVLAALPTSDGAGVRLNRALGHRDLSVLDPFLLLDEFHTENPNDYLAGFPEHPHRGFETVTYMIHGAMEHRDVLGNQGRLGPGSAQWMTAGHGIIHSEMPKQERGLMWGFQLWVNLPRARKLIPPRYQDIAAARIPEVEIDGARVRIVAGTTFGRTGPVDGIDIEPLFLDVAIQKGSRVVQPVPEGHTTFAFVTDGTVRLGASRREVSKGSLAILEKGASVELTGEGQGGRVLLLAGRPFNEPVARAGPFVMNTEDELRQAFDDYRSGRLLLGT